MLCKAYAEENGLRYYDFNEKSLYEEVGYEIVNDNREDQHANIWGAEKMTQYLGKVLAEECGISSKKDEQWESTSEYYAAQVKDCELPYVEDIAVYLELLKDERYTIFIAFRDDAAVMLNEQVYKGLRSLGIGTELTERNIPRISEG